MPKPEKPRKTRLQKLQKSWRKASAEERRAFMTWIGEGAEEAGASPALPFPITTGRYLTAEAADRITARLRETGRSLDDLKRELDLEPDDNSLVRALALKTSLRLAVVARLERWLAENGPPTADGPAAQ